MKNVIIKYIRELGISRDRVQTNKSKQICAKPLINKF